MFAFVALIVLLLALLLLLAWEMPSPVPAVPFDIWMTAPATIPGGSHYPGSGG